MHVMQRAWCIIIQGLLPKLSHSERFGRQVNDHQTKFLLSRLCMELFGGGGGGGGGGGTD